MTPTPAGSRPFCTTPCTGSTTALRPVPVLAADVPKVSKDGTTWTIPIRSGLTFSDDSALDAGDVAATLRLARSLACPFADACRIAAEHLQDVQVKGESVVLTLDRPWAPLLATFLADLPILPSDGLQASLDRLVDGRQGRRPQGPQRVDRAHLGRGQRRGLRWRRAACHLRTRRAYR